MKWLTLYMCSVFVVLASGQTDQPESTTPDPIVIPEDILTPDDETTPEPVIPRVTIPQGTVVGTVATDGDYFEFHGIPYADSTSGTHRFKAPRAPPSFQEEFFAIRNDIKCVRALGVGYEGTEDCLVANVFTPIIEQASQLPVMVWIKGMEFDKVVEHELSFKNFVAEGVVVVSLNYRESILGFLCLGTEAAPGNAGLKDIIAGLQWVKENIEQFGGNPNDITLFGHGSGAAAVDLITLSPLAGGLVDKAIAQSGNAMAPWAVARDNLEYAVQVAEALGHVVTDIQQLSEVFSRTSVGALMGVINELDLTENALAFAPCVEREGLEGVEPFLIKTPSEIIADGEFLQIPFITGFVDNEGTIRAEEALVNDWLERMDNSFASFLQSDLKFESDQERSEIAQRIRQFYFEDDRIDLSTVGDYIAYHGETMVLVSSLREVRTRAQSSTAPTYLYQFSYKGTIGESFAGPLEVETAGHSEELAYMFYGASEGISDRDYTIGQILVERWTNFAKTGSPSSQISTVNWQPYTTDNAFYLRVLASDEVIERDDSTLEVALVNPHPETLRFWDEVYTEHFLDAESNWSLNERNEDEELPEGDEDSNDAENEAPEIPDGNDVGGIGVDENPDDNNQEGGGEEDNDDNSASTAVGYTFLIVTLFSLLGNLHTALLVS